MLTMVTIDLPDDCVELLREYVDAAGGDGKRRLLRRPGRFVTERATAARRVLDQGTGVAVHLVHDDPPAAVGHEHGLLVVAPIDGQSAQLFDISSVDGDPRWDLHQAGELFRREWRWIRLGELGPHGFAATGAPVRPIDLGELHGTALETYLTERDEGWPGDDATLDRSLADICAMAQRTG